MSRRKKGNGGATELAWSGDLTIRRIAALKDEVSAALQAADVVRLRLEADAQGDAALLQLLCSAHRTALREGKAFLLIGDLPEQIDRLLRLAGFTRHVGCCHDRGGSCLWTSRRGVPAAAAAGKEGDR